MDESKPTQNPNQDQPPVTNDNPPTETAPTTDSQPGSVTVSTDDQSAPASEPQSVVGGANSPPVTSNASDKPKRSGKGLLVSLVILIVILGLGAIGYMVTRPQKSTKVAVVVTKKDIPVLQVAVFAPLPHDYYPNMANDSLQQDVNTQLFEGLTKFVNGTTLAPGLADSWTNPDTSTWVFKLHPNVLFHTGKTMTASDVKASIEAIQATDYGKIFASTIQSVTVVDPLTVKITTKGPDPILTNELTNVFIYDTTSGKQNDPVNGTGPYTLSSDTKDAIKLVAFDKYYGGHVYTREVDYLGYENGAAVPAASLQSHQIQLMTIVSDPTFVASLKTDGYNLTKVPSYSVNHLVFNTSKPGTPFANVKVRQAIAQAIDKNALIALKDSGAAVATQPVPNGIPGYNPTIKALPFSIANAKKALTDAGYPNGFSFKLTYFPPTQDLADAVQKQMAAIGVTVVLDPEGDQQQLIKIAIGGGTDMYYNSVSSSYVDASDILSDYVDSANYTNAAMDKLNTAASQELNPTKRVAILQQMVALAESDQADIPLFQRQNTVLATAPNVVINQENIGIPTGTYFWQDYAK